MKTIAPSSSDFKNYFQHSTTFQKRDPQHVAPKERVQDVVEYEELGLGVDVVGNTTLSYVAERGSVQGVRQCVVELCMRVNWQNINGDTPLSLAVANGHFDVVTMLLEYGANPNLRNVNGESALHFAACLGDIDVCGELIKFGAWLETEDVYGDTPLHWAVRDEQRSFIYELLEHGSNPYHKNEDGESPIELAEEIGAIDILQIFDNYGLATEDFSDGAVSFSRTVELPAPVDDDFDDWEIDCDDLGTSGTVVPSSWDNEYLYRASVQD